MTDNNGHTICIGDIVCFHVSDTIGFCEVEGYLPAHVMPKKGSIFLRFGGNLSPWGLVAYDSIPNDGYFYTGLPAQITEVAATVKGEVYAQGEELSLLHDFTKFGI